MYAMKKRKRTIGIGLVTTFLLLFSSKSDAIGSSEVNAETGNEGRRSANLSAPVKFQETAKLDEGESLRLEPGEGESDSKLEKSENPNTDDQAQNSKVDEKDRPSREEDSNHEDDDKKSSKARDEKSQEIKSEEKEHHEDEEGNKKQNMDKEEIEHKTNLNDVNSYAENDETPQATKREVGVSYTEFLGLPRDASYFFDDLEPFINNNSDSRVGRAAPSRETKNQKSRLSGKGKENVDDDGDDEEDEALNEEDDEKVNEDDYDEDEDVDSDCRPNPTPGHTTPACKTTAPACSTTKCAPTNVGKSSSKCPRICQKANRRNLITPGREPNILRDEEKKKNRNNKRKYQSKLD